MLLLVAHDVDVGRMITVWDLHTSRKLGEHEFNWVPFQITVAKDKAIILPWTDGRTHPIFVWDLSSDQVHEFGSFSGLWLWHADADQNVLVTIEINWSAHPPEVQQTKWALIGGEPIHRKHFHLSLGDRHLEESIIWRQFQEITLTATRQ